MSPASTDYGKDGVLYAANEEADAKRVMEMIEGCEHVETATSDHDIHFIYSDQFIDICRSFRDTVTS